MPQGDNLLERAARVARPRRRLMAFANMVEAGAMSVVETPPSRRRPEPVRIVFTGAETLLEVEEAGAVRATPFDPASGVAARIRAEGVRRVDLVLRDGACLDLAFALPEASLGDLRAMIDNEIVYQSPFELDEALWCWTARREGAGADVEWRISVALTLAGALDPVLAALQEAGIRITAVRRQNPGAEKDAAPGNGSWAAAPDWACAPDRAAAASPAAKAASAVRRLPAVALLPAAAVVAFLVVVGGRYATLAMESNALALEAGRAQTQIAVATQASMRSRALTEEQQLSALRLATIGRIAAALPDDTWLNALSVTGEGFEIAGFGPSAARTTEDLARIHGIGGLRFAAPIARNSRQRTERFRIAGTVGPAAPGAAASAPNAAQGAAQ
ncbi:MAG: PilN domain-containing protein [Pseudomonadota bacterium]